MIGQVYRVRTAPEYCGSNPNEKQHFAVQGSLVVIQGRWASGNYHGLAPSAYDGQQKGYNFRPCDLQRLPYHDGINR